jgi:SAM-dependent methyltransferase
VDLPRSFVIRERDHRIHNAITEEKISVLGRAIGLRPGMSVLDLACGSGEMLCLWARDHGVTGTGVDISTHFLRNAEARAVELGVDGQVSFAHGDASDHVAPDPVDVAACIGATWIGDGVAGTIDLLERSLRPGGLLLVGEPFWRMDPPDQATVEGCHATSKDDYYDLPGLVALFGALGWDLVEMVLADEDSWDRYVAAQWFSIRRWLDANPDDELAAPMRAELNTAPLDYVRYLRPHLGWGVFALKRR